VEGETDEGYEAPPRRRRHGWRYAVAAVAALAFAFSLLNASWLAPRPPGSLIVVANRGIALPVDRAALKSGGCPAAHILPPGDNPYIENTRPSLYRAVKSGADAVNVQVARTRDGQMVVFHDETLDCRTNGHGPIRALSLAEVKQLDAGYGYTADGGRTYPFRGKGVGAIPTVEEVLREIPTAHIVFALKGSDPAEADALVAVFRRAEVPIDERFGFKAAGAVAQRIRRLVPGAWVLEEGQGDACLADYVKLGWTGFTPASCRNTTIVLTLDRRWALWGWPYRFLDRMAKANSRVVIRAGSADGEPLGLDRPEQYDQVPADFHGWLWVDDFYTMGPALQR
jgi:glycerophosphoryl diester phosphodiesterase